MLSKRIKSLVEEAAKELGIPLKDAVTAYRQYWVWVKNTVEGMELENASEEDFKSQRVSINIPFIGKFYSSFKKVQKAQKQEEIINERIKNKERSSTT